jgi:7-cyano-7-deazaguanine synthase
MKPELACSAFTSPAPEVAVLCSGGIDSCVLLAEAASAARSVTPIYVRCGLRWERDELRALSQFCQTLRGLALKPLVVLELPVQDVYGAHWSVAVGPVPDEHTDAAAVYLPGRNILLLAKAALWCALNRVPVLAVASLSGNPFPDATPFFYRTIEQALRYGLLFQLYILTPYRGMSKGAIIARAAHLPLELTLSCLAPTNGRHCGRCNKCAERKEAFRAAGLPDRTEYAT